MWVERLKILNFRCFGNAELLFSKGINMLVGPNNSGKSSLLLPLLGLQKGLPRPTRTDVRLGASNVRIDISFGNNDLGRFLEDSPTQLRYEYGPENRNFPLLGVLRGAVNEIGTIPNREPGNFIYPFVSKRKVTELGEGVSKEIVETVPSTFENLNAKIDRLTSPEYQLAHERYMRACTEILGFKITTTHSSQGKRAVYTVENENYIPLLSMGEGVMNILGLVVHLVVAEKKLFLIEEPENDVHPRALKALLDLIIEKSSDNQFIITTHSNIVLKRLGAAPDAKVFRVSSEFKERLPTSIIQEVGPKSEDRRLVLSELGYEHQDVDLWEGWLFLEESSAEKIIREYLLKWFYPDLCGRLRTFSAHSWTEVPPKFRDFNDLFVFLHLEPAYKNRAWVVIDGGEEEKAIVRQLQETYVKSEWKGDHFRQFTKHDFEEYYPEQFAGEVTRIKSLADKQARRAAKKALLESVEAWIKEDDERAKDGFATSAAEVIEVLKEISASLK